MSHYRSTFMGHVGFDQLHRFTRQATEFGREIVNILNERALVEQNYAKSLRRLGQRVSKATSLILVSPLSNAWKTVGVEMEKEAELHGDFANALMENCVQPLSMLTERQVKPRRTMEQQVEETRKKWTERQEEHVKIKKRLHTVARENESLIDQIDGPRPKTEKDQQKLVTKQISQEKALYRADHEYYNSLIHLERSRQDWESASYDCCDAFEDMDNDRFNRLCDILAKYGDAVYKIPSKMKNICRTIDDANHDLSSPKEISIVRDKLRVGPYESEQLLCGYYQENFSCQMGIDRRKASVKELLHRYIADSQKEKTHRDGLMRLDQKMDGANFTAKLNQSSTMVTFFDLIRYKLNCTLASLEGNPPPTHPLSDNIEHHTDKQGIIYSTLKLKPGEYEEKMKNSHKSRSSRPKSSKNRAPSPQSSRNSSSHRQKSVHRNSSEKKSAPLASRKQNSSSSLQEHRRRSSNLYGASSQLASSPTPSQGSNPPPYNNAVNGNESQPVVCQCIAIYDYAATREDELSIHEGDIIKVFEKGEDGWWRGEVNGTVGLFPANYIETEISV